MKKLLLPVLVLFISFFAFAVEKNDVRYEEEDITRFNEVMELLKSDRGLPMDQTVIKIAKHFLGTPYVSFTLEKDPEKLTVNTRETDCILFVEMCLAMSITSKDDNPTFDRYIEVLKSLRYRNGVVDGYASRLHYTSEWIIQGTGNGYFHEITGEIGGIPWDQKFNFMSKHPNSYRQIKENPELVGKIREAEQNLEKYSYVYIPKPELPNHINGIKSGDIICFNDATPGLDIAHVALAYWENGKLTFIHASMGAKKVIINPTPLVDYTNGVKGHNGLRVVRINER